MRKPAFPPTFPQPAPWKPFQWQPPEVAAIQALNRGDATADQQKRALEYIINDLAGTYDLSYRPGSEEGRRDTDFAEGKRFVGSQIVKALKLNLAAIRQATSTQETGK